MLRCCCFFCICVLYIINIRTHFDPQYVMQTIKGLGNTKITKTFNGSGDLTFVSPIASGVLCAGTPQTSAMVSTKVPFCTKSFHILMPSFEPWMKRWCSWVFFFDFVSLWTGCCAARAHNSVGKLASLKEGLPWLECVEN